ncbi:UDP-N-acetylglucosamine 2-epimerase [Georgenia sp. SUBG003]|uniref:UDP-N-acetylglucosamine 2-epimerase n=1 Tax=Georgenia sp. SUBG003 TaxID=1497974 RepID=UPI003AB8B8D5
MLNDLKLSHGAYLVASAHREENVDMRDRLGRLLNALAAVALDQGVPVLLSTHPRTRKRIEEYGIPVDPNVTLHPPLGFSRLRQSTEKKRSLRSL